jgi:hypothetical protein
MRVTLGGNWRIYTNTVPEGCEVVGVVWRDFYDRGALVRTSAGLYAQLNDGVLRTLPQREVVEAIRERRN